MAAPSYVYTIARVAKMPGKKVKRLEEIAMDMEPEGGCLTILGVGNIATTAFTSQGAENLNELLEDSRGSIYRAIRTTD